MKVSKQIITFFLAFAMLFSLLTFASASAPSGVMVDNTSVTAWDELIANNVKSGVSVTVMQSKYWSHIDSVLSRYGIGALNSYDELTRVTSNIDMSGSGWFGIAVESVLDSFAQLWSSPDYVVMYDSFLCVYRPYDSKAQLWVVNSLGHFPYYRPDAVDDTTGTETIRTGQWIESSKLGSDTDLWHVASNYELNEYRDQWLDLYPNAKVTETTNYYWLTIQTATAVWVLCDKYGYPYYLPKDGKTAIGTENNYYQDTTNEYIDDDSVHVEVQDGGSALVGSPIDVNNGIVNVGGEVFYIDELIYDASTQTYYVDAHDEYVFNSTTNNYTTNNYSFTIQYHIDHTSITYIGQTEEYEKRYEMYFELPDGRSSADLTAEDLEQLSVVFADVIPYNRTADNLTQRLLLHFDGNTEDSSYFSYCTDFWWYEGASITYMDEGVFGGSLYLDELCHNFYIALPSVTDVLGSWTFQFRYYQSHTEAPAQDSNIYIGGQPVLSMDGQEFYWGDFDRVAADIPVGSWMEICLEHNLYGWFNLYINGTYADSYEIPSFNYPSIEFVFGAEQQTYKKIDEMRFSSGLVYDESDYTPSSVPFDSNLTLVLPDGDTAIADENAIYVPYDGTNFFEHYRLTDWTEPTYIRQAIDTSIHLSSVGDNPYVYFTDEPDPFLHGNGYSLFAQYGGGTWLRFNGSPSIESAYNVAFTYEYVKNALFLPVSYNGNPAYWCSNENWSEYTLSFVYSDGAYTSVTFDNRGTIRKISGVSNRLQFESVELTAHKETTDSDYYTRGIMIYGSTTILYAELVYGDIHGFRFEYESAVYKSSDLDSPTLAVKTDREITGYQIGGVRPSYPTTGLVYAMVENSRIVSLQQYTGYAWEAVDGRIWTGERWIPYSSFDVFTLQDFYDIIGGSDDDYEYIYTESGFWAWWQKQWKEFTSTLFGLLEKILKVASGGGGDLSISIENNTIIDEEDKEPFNPDVYRGVIKTMRRSVEFFTGFFGFIYGGINDFIDHLTDTSSEFYGLFQLTGLG